MTIPVVDLIFVSGVSANGLAGQGGGQPASRAPAVGLRRSVTVR